MDNLMLLTEGDNHLVSIWMLNMWMEWLLFLWIYERTLIRCSRVLYDTLSATLLNLKNSPIFLDRIWKGAKIEKNHATSAIFHPTWILQCAIGFMTPIVEKRKLCCKSINFSSNNRSILPQQQLAACRKIASFTKREKKVSKVFYFLLSWCPEGNLWAFLNYNL